MAVNDGFTMIPNEIIQTFAYLPYKAFRTLIVLYYSENLSPRERAENEVITTLTDIKRVLGYTNKNLSIPELRQILKDLETAGVVTDLVITDKGEVSLTLVKLIKQYRGIAYFYNSRLLRGTDSLKDGELKTFLFLLSYGGFERINLSQETIANRTAIHHDTVANNIKTLCNKGIISKYTKQAYTDGGKRDYNAYTIIERVNNDYYEEDNEYEM